MNLIRILRDRYQKPDISNIDYLIEKNSFSIKDCFIKLAIIRQEKQKQTELSALNNNFNATSRRHLHSFEAIHNPKETIEIANIFDFEGEHKEIRRILVEGRAGIGKSTLCQFVANRWAEQDKESLGVWTDKFKLIFWIPLRALKECDINANNLIEFIYSQCEIQDILPFEVFEKYYIELEQHSAVLYLLDGFDEVAELFHETVKGRYGKVPSGRSQLLRNLLNKPNWLLTSRPGYVAQNIINYHQHLETVGFTDDNITNYVSKYFINFNQQEKAIELLAFMEKQVNIRSIAHIPINAELLCSIWKNSNQLKTLSNQAQNTMSVLYKQLVWYLEGRYLKEKCQIDIDVISPEEYENQVACRRLILFLEEFGWQLMQQEDLIFKPSNYIQLLNKYFPDNKESELAQVSIFKHMGLFKETGDPKKNLLEQNYYFIHLTFQEFFAARYIVSQLNLYESNDIWNFIKQNKYNLKYQTVWRFLAGNLTNNIALLTKFLSCLMEEPHQLFGYQHIILLMSCLSECISLSNKLESECALKYLTFWIVNVFDKFVPRTCGPRHKITDFLRDYPALFNFSSIQQYFLTKQKDKDFLKYLAELYIHLPSTLQEIVNNGFLAEELEVGKNLLYGSFSRKVNFKNKKDWLLRCLQDKTCKFFYRNELFEYLVKEDSFRKEMISKILNHEIHIDAVRKLLISILLDNHHYQADKNNKLQIENAKNEIKKSIVNYCQSYLDNIHRLSDETYLDLMSIIVLNEDKSEKAFCLLHNALNNHNSRIQLLGITILNVFNYFKQENISILKGIFTTNDLRVDIATLLILSEFEPIPLEKQNLIIDLVLKERIDFPVNISSKDETDLVLYIREHTCQIKRYILKILLNCKLSLENIEKLSIMLNFKFSSCNDQSILYGLLHLYTKQPFEFHSFILEKIKLSILYRLSAPDSQWYGYEEATISKLITSYIEIAPKNIEHAVALLSFIIPLATPYVNHNLHKKYGDDIERFIDESGIQSLDLRNINDEQLNKYVFWFAFRREYHTGILNILISLVSSDKNNLVQRFQALALLQLVPIEYFKSIQVSSESIIQMVNGAIHMKASTSEDKTSINIVNLCIILINLLVEKKLVNEFLLTHLINFSLNTFDGRIQEALHLNLIKAVTKLAVEQNFKALIVHNLELKLSSQNPRERILASFTFLLLDKSDDHIVKNVIIMAIHGFNGLEKEAIRVLGKLDLSQYFEYIEESIEESFILRVFGSNSLSPLFYSTPLENIARFYLETGQQRWLCFLAEIMQEKKVSLYFFNDKLYFSLLDNVTQLDSNKNYTELSKKLANFFSDIAGPFANAMGIGKDIYERALTLIATNEINLPVHNNSHQVTENLGEDVDQPQVILETDSVASHSSSFFPPATSVTHSLPEKPIGEFLKPSSNGSNSTLNFSPTI